MTFNQPLETRNVRRVDDMSYMFYQATSFNQDISTWVLLTKVRDTNHMFDDCPIKDEYKPTSLK